MREPCGASVLLPHNCNNQSQIETLWSQLQRIEREDPGCFLYIKLHTFTKHVPTKDIANSQAGTYKVQTKSWNSQNSFKQ